MPKKKTCEEFKAEVLEKFPNYDVSDVNYLGAKKHVNIRCKKHNHAFNQIAGQITKGVIGCKYCRTEKKSKPIEVWLEEAKIKHGDKYDYSAVDYKDRETPVKIKCPIHGWFEQKIYQHIISSGCPSCGKEIGINKQRMTLDEFIKKAIEKHGDKYDYSKTVLGKNNSDNVTIFCKKCKEFFSQRAGVHLLGFGCKKCGIRESHNKAKLTKEEFILKSKIKHGDKYDYDNVKMDGVDNKVEIICTIHGTFNQTPHMHMQGNGCPKCAYEKIGKEKGIGTERFIERSKEIFHNKFDYSYTKCNSLNDDVMLICPFHGKFNINAKLHLISHTGCPKCGDENRIISKDDFIERAREVHGDKYDYSEVKINSYKNPITISCPVHGKFEQSYTHHLYGHGCKKCAQEERKLSQKEFIEKAKEKHEGKYNYDKVDYVNSRSKVTITCPTHGDFNQVGNLHLRGSGCPKCSAPKGEKAVITILDKWGLDYTFQFRFPDTRYRYDFRLNEFPVLLEFDERRHYQTPENESDAKQIERDILKNQLAKNNNIKLIRIKEGSFDNLEEELIKRLSFLFPYYYRNKYYENKIELMKVLDNDAGVDLNTYSTTNHLEKLM